MKNRARRALVFNLMLDGLWHTTMDINSACIGGSEGCRRLRELRKQGHVFEKRKKVNSTQYEYRLVSPPKLKEPVQLELSL